MSKATNFRLVSSVWMSTDIETKYQKQNFFEKLFKKAKKPDKYVLKDFNVIATAKGFTSIVNNLKVGDKIKPINYDNVKCVVVFKNKNSMKWKNLNEIRFNSQYDLNYFLEHFKDFKFVNTI